MRFKSFKTALPILALALMFSAAQANAGSEDFQDFTVSCRNPLIDESDGSVTYPASGTTCSATPLRENCMTFQPFLRNGYDAHIEKRRGAKWVRVTSNTHYDACSGSGSSGRNIFMRFRVRATSTYRIVIDGVGDGKPSYVATALAFSDSSPNFKKFTIRLGAGQ